MNWNSVRGILQERLCSRTEGGKRLPKTRLKQWLDELYPLDYRIGERLAICLCIDLVAGALTADQVVPVIKRSTSRAPGAEHPLEAFAAAVEDLGCLCNHTHIAHSSYARVLNLRTYSSFYHEPSIPGAFGDELELRLLKEKLDAGQEEGAPMDAIDRTWSGRRPIVWVTQWTFVSELRKRLGEETASELNDVMGLGFEGEPCKRTFYAIRYPAEFPIVCRQPTTFDAAWKGLTYYLSYKKHDTWGLTHACSGRPCVCSRTAPAAPERVHPAFEAHLKFFRCFPLGTAQPASDDVDGLLAAAYERLDGALRAAVTETGQTA